MTTTTTGGSVEQGLAACVLVVVSLGWAWAARRRELYSSSSSRSDHDDDVFDGFGSIGKGKRDDSSGRRKRQKRLKSSTSEKEQQQQQQQQPAVGVVLPVRGASGRTTDNWRTQLNTTYDGDVSFVFVVEKDTDEAKREAERLALEVLRRDDDEEEEDKRVGRARRRSARVVVSGSAEGCSQKIAQQLRGVEELAAAAAAAGKKRVRVERDVEEDETKKDERGVGSASAEKYRRRSRRSRTNTKSPERNGRVKYVLFLDDDVMLYPSTIGSLVRAMEKDEKETGGNALLATGYPLDFVGGGVDGGESSSSCFANYMTMVYHLVLLIPFSHGKYTKNVWGGCMLFRLDDFQENACKVKEAYENGGYSDDLIVAAAANREKRSILCPGDALFPLPLDPKQTVGHFVNYFHRQIFVNDTYFDRHMKCINHGMLLAMFLSSLCLTCGTVSSAIDVALWVRSLATSSSQKSTTRTPTLAFAVFFAHFLAVTRAKKMYASCVSLCERTADADAAAAAAASRGRQTPPDAGRVARAGFNRTNWFKVWLALCVVYAAAPVLCAHVVFFSNDVTWGGIRYRKRHGKVTRVL